MDIKHYNNIYNYLKYNQLPSTLNNQQQQQIQKQSTKLPLHPIPVESPFYQIGIDFVGPLPIITNENKYIITAMDYLTKWLEAQSVKEVTAEQAAHFIYEEII
ncbi:21129_t:CDS:2, partial [Rhizophagus irregularis]